MWRYNSNMENIRVKDEYKLSRILYIIEASLEYFISIGISLTYLPVLGAALGMEGSLIAIIESFVSLGASFQIFAVLLVKKKRVKPIVTSMHILSQIFFACVWFIPLFKASKIAKIILFVCMLLGAHVIHNIINAPKINWYMSLVDHNKRGVFTAIKEIVSLIGGMLFTMLYGNMIQHFEEKGEIETAFILCGVLLLFIMLSHTLTLIFSKEKPQSEKEELEHEKPIKEQLKHIVSDKQLLKVILIPVFWAIVQNMTNPFYSVYQREVMGMQTATISLIIAVGSILRAVFSIPMGRYADKTSFSKMLNLCFLIALFGIMVNVFSGFMISETLSVVAVAGFWLLHYISFAGINSGIMNIIYDHVDKDRQMVALAFKSSFAGIVGFLTTVMFAPIVDWINSLNLIIFGYTVYAQQVLGVLAIIIIIFMMIYNSKVVGKQKKGEFSD